jgi:hypothetical protein
MGRVTQANRGGEWLEAAVWSTYQRFVRVVDPFGVVPITN